MEHPTLTEWKFIGISTDYDKFKIYGISIWSQKWKPVPDKFAYVTDPSYGQNFRFQVYMIEESSVQIEFAAGEFSSNVWGIYIQK
jgi:hypothetical protein